MVVKEVRYIRFEPEAANLIFQVVSNRHERTPLNRHQQQAVRQTAISRERVPGDDLSCTGRCWEATLVAVVGEVDRDSFLAAFSLPGGRQSRPGPHAALSAALPPFSLPGGAWLSLGALADRVAPQVAPRRVFSWRKRRSAWADFAPSSGALDRFSSAPRRTITATKSALRSAQKKDSRPTRWRRGSTSRNLVSSE
jgi:hypothetical protein